MFQDTLFLTSCFTFGFVGLSSRGPGRDTIDPCVSVFVTLITVPGTTTQTGVKLLLIPNL